jgi:hypothetical protein
MKNIAYQANEGAASSHFGAPRRFAGGGADDVGATFADACSTAIAMADQPAAFALTLS